MDETQQNTSSRRATPLVDAVICAGVVIAGYSVWQVGQEDPKVWSLPRLR